MIKLMNKMETSFYHDEPRKGMDELKKRKMTMTLDLDAKSAPSKKQKLNTVLASPDLNLLKLASPELERMIIQQNSAIITTPTPTQIVFPKYVTEEQEAYARGFIDALAELHSKEDDDSESSMSGEIPLTVVQSTSPVPSSQSSTSNFGLPTVAPLPGSVISTASSVPAPAYVSHNINTSVAAKAAPTYTVLQNVASSSASAAFRVKNEPGIPSTIPAPMPRVSMLKEEPQTVPCLGSTPPMSPINMEHQEDIKLERKRERNRLAARKCRTRKLERISRLEDRVNELKGQNADLSRSADSLREQVCKLKQQIMDHVNSGCHLMVSQNLS